MTFSDITPAAVDEVWDRYAFDGPLSEEQIEAVNHMTLLMVGSQMIERVTVNTILGIERTRNPHVRIAGAIAIALRIGWYLREQAERGTFPAEALATVVPAAEIAEIEEIFRQLRRADKNSEGDPGDEQR